MHDIKIFEASILDLHWRTNLPFSNKDGMPFAVIGQSSSHVIVVVSAEPNACWTSQSSPYTNDSCSRTDQQYGMGGFSVHNPYGLIYNIKENEPTCSARVQLGKRCSRLYTFLFKSKSWTTRELRGDSLSMLLRLRLIKINETLFRLATPHFAYVVDFAVLSCTPR